MENPAFAIAAGRGAATAGSVCATMPEASLHFDLNAIETGLRGKFQFTVRKDMKITWPRAETPTHWSLRRVHESRNGIYEILVG